MKASAIPESQNHGLDAFDRKQRASLIDMLRLSGLLAFGLTLWLANLLPIQKAILLCESNALVSEERWSHLTQLSGQPELESASIRWVSSSHASSTTSVTGSRNAPIGESYRQLKLRMGMHRKVSAMELQQELDRLTNPASLETSSVRRPSLHRERWQVQVAKHALSRFRLDCERRGLAIAKTTTSSPFRLASSSTDPMDSDDRGMLERLTRNLADAEHALALAESEHRTPALSASGPMALTGAPTFYVQGSQPSLLNAISLALLAMGVSWCGCIWVVSQHSASSHARLAKRQHSAIDAQRTFKSLINRLCIPYLGEIQVLAKESGGEQHQENAVPLTRSRSISRWTKIARWSDGILILWVAGFVLRYSIDPMWRELLFRAPLAAFSCLVSGI